MVLEMVCADAADNRRKTQTQVRRINGLRILYRDGAAPGVEPKPGMLRQILLLPQTPQIFRPVHVVPTWASLDTQSAPPRGFLSLLQSPRRRPLHAAKHFRMRAPATDGVIASILARAQ